MSASRASAGYDGLMARGHVIWRLRQQPVLTCRALGPLAFMSNDPLTLFSTDTAVFHDSLTPFPTDTAVFHEQKTGR